MILQYIFVGFFAGLHRASWGAYKDSPFEDFNKQSFLRSLILSPMWSVVLYYLLPTLGISRDSYQLVHIFSISLTFDTITLEFYKLFFRTESQKKYFIPSRFNILGTQVKKNFRMLLGVICFLFMGTLFYLLTRVELSLFSVFHSILVGFFMGFLGGVLEALGGSWKDAPFEGFDKLKFFRSPVIAGIWGIVFILHQSNLGILLFSVAGAVRMTVEVHKAFLKGYHSGKFKEVKPVFKYWSNNRSILFPGYILTWLIFILLLLSSFILNR